MKALEDQQPFGRDFGNQRVKGLDQGSAASNFSRASRANDQGLIKEEKLQTFGKYSAAKRVWTALGLMEQKDKKSVGRFPQPKRSQWAMANSDA